VADDTNIKRGKLLSLPLVFFRSGCKDNHEGAFYIEAHNLDAIDLRTDSSAGRASWLRVSAGSDEHTRTSYAGSHNDSFAANCDSGFYRC
jgi:hypothetical protein